MYQKEYMVAPRNITKFMRSDTLDSEMKVRIRYGAESEVPRIKTDD